MMILLFSLFITPLNSSMVIFAETHLTEPIETHAQAAALIDVKSGRILHHHHGDEQMLIASLTKVMTAIVAIEHGNLSDQVKVGPRAYRKEGSSIYLELGEEMSLEHLLYGLMLRSGNDAATAIAEHVGGSEEGFVFLMNEKAKWLGLHNTSFANPHGLNQEGHYSTANDLAKLTAYALQNPVFREIVKTKVKRVPNPHESWDYTWYNKNKMLTLYEGADGVKTGYTKLAGRCLISSATRDGQQLVVVTLNDGRDWADHAAWLDYGFERFQLHTLIEKGAPINERITSSEAVTVPDQHPNHAKTRYVAGSTFVYALTEEEVPRVTTRVEWIEDSTSVDYKLGERGRLLFLLDDHVIGSVPIVEQDSDRLRLDTRQAFAFQVSDTNHRSGGFLSVLYTVVKALFTGGTSSW